MELIAVTLFIIKHIVADYFMQYSWMVKDKGTYGAWGGLAHSGWHGLLTTAVVWHLTGLHWFLLILFGLFDAVIHYHVDFVKSNIWKYKNYGPKDQMYWVTHGIDQLIHFFTYIFIIWMLLTINAID
jgi:hypothetical protein